MMRGIRKAGLLLFLAALPVGCAYGVRTAMFRAPYPTTASLDVFRDEGPDRQYVEIAQLETSREGNALGRLVEGAKQVGADAIIILPLQYVGTSYYYGWRTPYYDLEVIAIKYR